MKFNDIVSEIFCVKIFVMKFRRFCSVTQLQIFVFNDDRSIPNSRIDKLLKRKASALDNHLLYLVFVKFCH